MSHPTARIARARRIGAVHALACALGMCMLAPQAHAVTTHSLSGTVTALPGTTPVADVTVDVHDASTDALVATSTTDADGHYATTVAAGSYELHATPPAGSPFRDATTRATSVSADTTVDIGLVGPGVNAVQGTVVDRMGAPVEGMTMMLANSASFASMSSDAAGRYAMVLPDGSYELEGWLSSPGRAGLADQSDFEGSVTIAGDRDEELRLRTNEVSVHVVTTDGTPVSGATVATGSVQGVTSLFGQSVSAGSSDTATSDGAGVAQVYVYDVNATGPTQAPRISVSPPAGSGLASVKDALPSIIDGDIDVTVRLPSARDVRGTVIDRAGAPVRGMSIDIRNDDSFASASSDATGRYAMALPDGSYAVHAWVLSPDRDGLADSNSFAGSVTIAGDRDDDLLLRPNEVAVHLVAPDGAPVNGATVATDYVQGVTSLFGQSVSAGSYDTATSDVAGVARVYVYDVNATGPTEAPRISVSPPVGSGLAPVRDVLPSIIDGDIDVTVRLRAARDLRGTVSDRAGAPIEGMLFELNSSDSSAWWTTDAAGRYAMGLADGPYSVEAWSPIPDRPGRADSSYVYGSLTITGDRDDDLRLHPNELSVHLVASDPGPLSGARVATGDVRGTTSWFGQAMSTISSDAATTDGAGVARVYVYDVSATSPADRPRISVTPPDGSGLPGAYVALPEIDGDTTLTLSYVGGTPSAVAVMPNAHDLGAVVTGSTDSVVVAMSNVLGRDVTPSELHLSGPDSADFHVVAQDCTGHALHELESCTVSVDFTPSAYGPKSATLTIVDDGPASPRRVVLTGAGKDVVKPTIEVQSPKDDQAVGVGDALRAHFSCADEPVGSGLASCVGDVADGQALDTSSPGRHAFTVNARDSAGNERTTTVSYTVIAGPGPDAPALSGTVPPSPRNENAPKLVGSAPSGTTVQLYALAGCGGASVASGTAAQLASPGIGVSVADNWKTSFSATATDAAGRVSGCSQKVDYVEDSIGPAVAVTKHSLPVFATVGQPARVTVEFVTSEDAVAGCRIRRLTETPPPPYVEPCRSGDMLEVAASPVVVTRTYVIEVLARDAASNTGFGSATVLIQWQPAASARAQITAPAPGIVFVTDSARVVVPRARVTCPSVPPRCEVTTTARLLGRRARSRASVAKVPAGRRIGVGSYRLAAGRTGKARFTLSKQAMRELRRGLLLTATVEIAVKHGNRTTSKTVQLKIVKKRKPRSRRIG